jgi:hypothetical protein
LTLESERERERERERREFWLEKESQRRWEEHLCMLFLEEEWQLGMQLLNSQRKGSHLENFASSLKKL